MDIVLDFECTATALGKAADTPFVLGCGLYNSAVARFSNDTARLWDETTIGTPHGGAANVHHTEQQRPLAPSGPSRARNSSQ